MSTPNNRRIYKRTKYLKFDVVKSTENDSCGYLGSTLLACRAVARPHIELILVCHLPHYTCIPTHKNNQLFDLQSQNFPCIFFLSHWCLTFYPTALKGCWGIVFSHGVQMGGWAGARVEKVCLGCISETVRCRKLIHVRDIG